MFDMNSKRVPQATSETKSGCYTYTTNNIRSNWDAITTQNQKQPSKIEEKPTYDDNKIYNIKLLQHA